MELLNDDLTCKFCNSNKIAEMIYRVGYTNEIKYSTMCFTCKKETPRVLKKEVSRDLWKKEIIYKPSLFIRFKIWLGIMK